MLGRLRWPRPARRVSTWPGLPRPLRHHRASCLGGLTAPRPPGSECAAARAPWVGGGLLEAK
eukprot:1731140-Pyramimonas_sp.AAC.1